MPSSKRTASKPAHDPKGNRNTPKARTGKKQAITLDDYLRASRRGNREAEQEMLGPGFHSHSRPHKSKKLYSRKEKHQGRTDLD